MDRERIGRWVSALIAIAMMLVGGNWEPFAAANLIIVALGENS